MTDLCKICCITLVLVSALLHVQYFRCTKLKASCPYSCKEKKISLHIGTETEQCLFSFLIKIYSFEAVELWLEADNINGIYKPNTSLFYLLGSNKWLARGLCRKCQNSKWHINLLASCQSHQARKACISLCSSTMKWFHKVKLKRHIELLQTLNCDLQHEVVF